MKVVAVHCFSIQKATLNLQQIH